MEIVAVLKGFELTHLDPTIRMMVRATMASEGPGSVLGFENNRRCLLYSLALHLPPLLSDTVGQDCFQSTLF